MQGRLADHAALRVWPNVPDAAQGGYTDHATLRKAEDPEQRKMPLGTDQGGYTK